MKLSVVACVLGAACSRSQPSTISPGNQPGGVERFEIGSLVAYALADGHLAVPNDGELLGYGRPPAEIAEVLAAAGLPRDTIRLDIQCLLVRADDRVILFDAGTGDPSLAETGQLVRSLAGAGVAPSQITDIFVSHAHGDHVGGLVTRPGSLAFPAATIHLSAPEWASLRAEAETDPHARRIVAAIAPKVAAFAPGAHVLPIVRAVATPGHTIGHSSYEIDGGSDKLLYLGDLAHHSIISVERPAWLMRVDADRPGAEAMRQQTLAALARDRTLVLAPHFPYPGVGRVVSRGQGLAWSPERR